MFDTHTRIYIPIHKLTSNVLSVLTPVQRSLQAPDAWFGQSIRWSYEAAICKTHKNGNIVI